MAEKSKIRFVDSQYNTLFYIDDGESIVIEDSEGNKTERVCGFIDPYHTRVGNNIFHICEFAGCMENQHKKYYPARRKDNHHD